MDSKHPHPLLPDIQQRYLSIATKEDLLNHLVEEDQRTPLADLINNQLLQVYPCDLEVLRTIIKRDTSEKTAVRARQLIIDGKIGEQSDLAEWVRGGHYIDATYHSRSAKQLLDRFPTDAKICLSILYNKDISDKIKTRAAAFLLANLAELRIWDLWKIVTYAPRITDREAVLQYIVDQDLMADAATLLSQRDLDLRHNLPLWQVTNLKLMDSFLAGLSTSLLFEIVDKGYNPTTLPAPPLDPTSEHILKSAITILWPRLSAPEHISKLANLLFKNGYGMEDIPADKHGILMAMSIA